MRILYDDGGDGGGTGDQGGGGQQGDQGGGGTGDQGGGGSGGLPAGAFKADAWRDALPEDIRGHASLAKYGNLEEGARAFIGAQHLIGKSPDQIMDRPKAGDMEARRTAMTTLGALPALENGKTGDFKLAAHAPEGIPEWLGIDQSMSVGLVEQAHKLGFMPDQVQGLYGWFVDTMMATEKQQADEAVVSAETDARSLENMWGTGKFDQNLAAANFAIDKLGGEELRNAIDGANLGTNPLLLDAFQKVGFMLAEDTSGGGGEPNFGTGDVSGGLKSEANDLIAISIDQTKTSKERRDAAEAAQAKFAQAQKLDDARKQKSV